MRAVIKEMQTRWVRFNWNLSGFNFCAPLPTAYQSSDAAPEDLAEILEVVISAYASDTVWAYLLDGLKLRLMLRIEETLGSDKAVYLIVKEGARIVGVSGVAESHWTGQNLLTGVCVLPASQKRGIGAYLLGASLMRLRAMGVKSANVYTAEGSIADCRLYRMFDSVREEDADYPALVQS